jgi:hypothetical protein
LCAGILFRGTDDLIVVFIFLFSVLIFLWDLFSVDIIIRCMIHHHRHPLIINHEPDTFRQNTSTLNVIISYPSTSTPEKTMIGTLSHALAQ